MKFINLAAILLATLALTGSSSDQYVLPPENYKHWQKLEKVCEEGRKTYGVNEFVEKGKVCRWTFVPYWPEKKEK